MDRKSNKLEYLLLLILLISFGALLYFYLYKNLNNVNSILVTNSQEDKKNIEYTKQKEDIMPILLSFKKYGTWPEIPFQLSQKRGNPFQEKLQDDLKEDNN